MLPKDEPQSAIANFPPGYFALVMATGIVSIASHRLGIWVIAIPFFWLNVLFYIGLWMITGSGKVQKIVRETHKGNYGLCLRTMDMRNKSRS